MMQRKLTFGVPEWARMGILAISVSVGLIGAYTAWNFDSWNTGKPEWLVYGLWAIAGTQLLFLLRFRNIPWVNFVADSRGLKVRATYDPEDRNRWITVNWADVGEIEVAWFRRRRPRIAMELFICDADIERYFSAMAKARRFLGQPVRNENGAFAIQFKCAFHKPAEVVAQLEGFRGATHCGTLV